MLYYLLQNSSFIKKKNDKDKLLYTLIGGSLIYLILHAFISHSFKQDIIKYLWFLFLIDVSAVAISTDIPGLTTTLQNNSSGFNTKENTEVNTDNREVNTEVNTKVNTEINTKELTEKNTKINSSNSGLNINNKRNKPKRILKKHQSKQKKNSKSVSFEDSTPIAEISSPSNAETYNSEEANSINLTLESLESLDNLNLDINDNLNVRRKKDDEYSDIGSELDLTKFENSITNST